MSDDYYIKKENGKEVVYRKGAFGVESKVGELHERWDGSKETRNLTGPKVKVERDTFSTRISQERNASVDGKEGKFSKDSVLGYELRNSPSFKASQRQSAEASGNQGSSSGYSSTTSSFSENNEQTTSAGMKWVLFWTILTETASLLRLKKLEKTLSGILSEVYSAEGYMLRAAEYAEKAGEIENAIQYYILYAIRIRGYEQNMGHIGKLAKEHGLENKVIEYYKREGLFKEAARYAEIFINNLQEASELYRTASGLIQDSDSYEAKDLMEKSRELENELKKQNHID